MNSSILVSRRRLSHVAYVQPVPASSDDCSGAGGDDFMSCEQASAGGADVAPVGLCLETPWE